MRHFICDYLSFKWYLRFRLSYVWLPLKKFRRRSQTKNESRLRIIDRKWDSTRRCSSAIFARANNNNNNNNNLLRLGVLQSSRWRTGWIRQDLKWIPEVHQKTQLWVPTSDHRCKRTAFDQSVNSQSNIEDLKNPRLWNLHRTVSYATVSEALEKSAIYIAMVTSPLFIALRIWSLIASKVVVVEWSLRFALTFDWSAAVSVKNSIICRKDNLSYTFDNTGKLKTGRKLSFAWGSPTFGMGLMSAVFQIVGKSSFEMYVFMICVKGDARWSESKLVGMFSGPVKQSDRSSLIFRRTCWWGNTLQTQGRIRVLRKCINKPMQLILVKCHWGSDTLSRRNKLLIQFIRIDGYWLVANVEYGWIVFHTSLGRLDERALVINVLFAFLISTPIWRLLRASLKISHAASLWGGVCAFLL